jgi:hypothetical protein
MGWSIVAQGFDYLFRHYRDALKVSLGPFALLVALVWLVFRVTGASLQMLMYGIAVGRMAPAGIVALSLIVLALVFVSSWVSVAWHRRMLLDERPGLLPRVVLGAVGAYTGRSLLIGVMLAVLMFPVSSVVWQMVGITGIRLVPGVDMLVGYGLSVFFFYLWLRVALILPAAAAGRVYSLSDAWNDGGRLSQDILLAAAICAALSLCFQAIPALLPLPGWLQVAVRLAVLWLTLMGSASVVTVLYGLVAGRRRLR